MQYRRLSRTDLEPLVLGFGCSMIASLATRHPRLEVERTLSEAQDAGTKFFNTGSLRRLGIGQIDPFLLHSPPVNLPGWDAVLDALSRLKEQGKIRHLG